MRLRLPGNVHAILLKLGGQPCKDLVIRFRDWSCSEPCVCPRHAMIGVWCLIKLLSARAWLRLAGNASQVVSSKTRKKYFNILGTRTWIQSPQKYFNIPGTRTWIQSPQNISIFLVPVHGYKAPPLTIVNGSWSPRHSECKGDLFDRSYITCSQLPKFKFNCHFTNTFCHIQDGTYIHVHLYMYTDTLVSTAHHPFTPKFSSRLLRLNSSILHVHLYIETDLSMLVIPTSRTYMYISILMK